MLDVGWNLRVARSFGLNQHLICDFQSSRLFSTSAAFAKNCGPKPAVRLRQKVTDCLIRRQPVARLICDFQSSRLFSTSAVSAKNCGPKPAVRLRQKVTDCSIRCRPVAQLTSNIYFLASPS